MIRVYYSFAKDADLEALSLHPLFFITDVIVMLLSSVFMLRAVDRSAISIDRATSRVLLLAQASTDGATINRSHCAIDG